MKKIMKKLTIILIMLISLLMGNILKAQNLGIGPDTFDPHPSAGVEMRFTNKGLLIPRLTLSQRNAISSPATSLIIYQTDNTPGYYYNAGTSSSPNWVRLATTGLDGSGVATRVAFWTGTNTLSSNANLYWDNTNGRLGIGTTTPQRALHVAPTSYVFNDGFEDGSLSPFTTGGTANWAISTTSPYAGSYCAESGTIAASQSTYMELTQSITFPGQISFAIKISSESNYDKLSFYIDGTLMSSWSGEVAWTTVSYAVSSGSHTFKWEYSKDGSVNSGSDKVWIDEIKILYLADLAIIEGNTDISGNTNIGGNANISSNAFVNGNVGIGTTSPTAKLHVVSQASQNIAYFYQTSNNYMYIQDTSATELLYAYKQQLTSKGDGQSTIYGYRTRDSQNDGTGYGYYTSNGAVKGFNLWGDLYSYGVGGFNWNDYNRSGGVLGAQYAGSYWASLGYKNSGGSTYGAYWTGSGSGSGYSATGSAMAGVGAGGYGDMLGLWSRGEVMGAIFAGELFSAYNVGNTYTSGTQIELVNNGTKKYLLIQLLLLNSKYMTMVSLH